jgi:integrase
LLGPYFPIDTGKGKENEFMGLYRRNGIFWMSFSVDGRQHKKSTGTEDKRIAQRIFDTVKGKIALGQWIPDEREQRKEYTFIELIEKYLSWAEGRYKAMGFKKDRINQLLNHFTDIPLSQFTAQNIEECQSKMLQKGNMPATANRSLAVLKHMFTKATEWNMVSEDVLKIVRNVKFLKEDNSRLRYLAVEECQSLINVCDNRLRPIIITALNTGMRRGEILSLEWDKHIDLKHGFILLDKTKNGERREIPINDPLRHALQPLIRRLDTPFVFYEHSGKPISDFRKSFSTALRKAGIKDFRFHDLRHTFASHLVMAGVDLTTVSRLLGHKSLTMTLRYAHLAPSHMVEAMGKIGDILGSKNASFEGKKPENYTNFRTVEQKGLSLVSVSV